MSSADDSLTTNMADRENSMRFAETSNNHNDVANNEPEPNGHHTPQQDTSDSDSEFESDDEVSSPFITNPLPDQDTSRSGLIINPHETMLKLQPGFEEPVAKETPADSEEMFSDARTDLISEIATPTPELIAAPVQVEPVVQTPTPTQNLESSSDNLDLNSKMDTSEHNINFRVNETNDSNTTALVTPPVSKPMDESFHDSTINTTSRFDDTQVQLDNEMTFSKDPTNNHNVKIVVPTERQKIISSPKVATKSASNSNTPRASNHRATASTSWGKFRPSSTYFEDIPNLQSFNPSAKSMISKNSFQSQDSTTSAKLDDLNKQITGYRIQIKFFKQFLQNLIDKTRLQSGDTTMLDINELTHFQKNFIGLSPQFMLQSSSDYTKLEGDYNNLLKNYDEVFKLNEDLYENLETFQNQIHAKDIQLQHLNDYIESCCKIIDEILQTLINNPNTDAPTREALSRCLESNTSNRSLELKLQVISFEFNKLINTSSPRLTMVPLATPTSSGYDRDLAVATPDRLAISSYVDIIKGLISSINKIEGEFNEQKEETSKIEELLLEEQHECSLIKEKYALISAKFKNLCNAIDADQMSLDAKELISLRMENVKLIGINQAVDTKFEEYQNIIDKLQSEVNEFKEFSGIQGQTKFQNSSSHSITDYSKDYATEFTNTSTDRDLQNDLFESHKALNRLHTELNDVLEKYDKLKMDSTATISSLTNELHSGKQDILNLKAEGRVSEVSKQDYDTLSEKQKSFKAENIRLNYKIENLTSERESFQATIRSLTDKITLLTVQGESSNSSTTSNTTASTNSMTNSGMINILEHQFKDLLQLDVHEFQKLLKSFNKIADDSSVKDPTRKIDNLSKRLFKINENRKFSEGNPWDVNEFNLIKDLHKSIFDYFARAVEMIVNDHVKLLLTESESNKQTEEYVDKLHKRIDELNNINDSLLKQLEVYDNTDMDSSFGRSSSPRTKLRMDELWNRWKSEREARVYESKQADRRLKELETENSRLRSELAKMAS